MPKFRFLRYDEAPWIVNLFGCATVVSAVASLPCMCLGRLNSVFADCGDIGLLATGGFLFLTIAASIIHTIFFDPCP